MPKKVLKREMRVLFVNGIELTVLYSASGTLYGVFVTCYGDVLDVAFADFRLFGELSLLVSLAEKAGIEYLPFSLWRWSRYHFGVVRTANPARVLWMM